MATSPLYAFDDIGNRTTTTNNGRFATYTANSLNQYSQRTVPGAVDVIGETSNQVTVVVNDGLADRTGRHFHRQVPVDNTSSSVYASFVTVAGIPGGAGGVDVVSIQTGLSFVARSPELFAYDADGNLTSDGRWTNTWDAENRLVAMETLPAITGAVPRVKLEFGYDSQSRRVRKRSLAWAGGGWTTNSVRSFVWDGWNLVAEVGTQDGAAVTNTFTWGLDLSGSLQGAGGVGGLLAIKQQRTNDTTVLLPYYDGNGNVMGMVDAANGTVVAVYEYDPFGDTLRSTGPRASGNPWRFSTKYTDQESGWLYYGYRYYAPRVGRWVSREPLSEATSGPVRFGMLLNDAVSNCDVLGLIRLRDFARLFIMYLQGRGPSDFDGYSDEVWEGVLARGEVADYKRGLSIRAADFNVCCTSNRIPYAGGTLVNRDTFFNWTLATLEAGLAIGTGTLAVKDTTIDVRCDDKWCHWYARFTFEVMDRYSFRAIDRDGYEKPWYWPDGGLWLRLFFDLDMAGVDFYTHDQRERDVGGSHLCEWK